MTQDETSVCASFVRKLPALAFLTLASGYGCGSPAPTSLFDATGSSALGNAGGSVLGSGGSGNASGASDGGSGLVGGGGAAQLGGASSGGASSGGASSGGAGGAAAAGAPSGGSSSGGVSSAGGSGGAPAPSACDGKLVKPPALVADFEQGVAGWFGYIDDNHQAPVTSSTPGAALTLHAATFSGGSATISGMYFPMPCRDVTDFDGISFWGRSEGTSAVRFLAVTPKTDPTAGIGDCDPAHMTCQDHPGKPFSFGSGWVLYHAAWAELKQLGFGSKASFSGVVNAVLWINDGPVDHFNFSIDQVSFYKGTPPVQ